MGGIGLNPRSVGTSPGSSGDKGGEDQCYVQGIGKMTARKFVRWSDPRKPRKKMVKKAMDKWVWYRQQALITEAALHHFQSSKFTSGGAEARLRVV